MADPFLNIADQSQPGNEHFLIEFSDDDDLPRIPRSIRCEEDGVAQVADRKGVVLPYTMVRGELLPFRGVRINETDSSGVFYGIL